MANQNPNDPSNSDKPQTYRDNTEVRGRQGGDRMRNQADDRSSGENEEQIQKPGEKDSDAARGSDKSINGDEFDREGRNPKPFSVS